MKLKIVELVIVQILSKMASKMVYSKKINFEYLKKCEYFKAKK